MPYLPRSSARQAGYHASTITAESVKRPSRPEVALSDYGEVTPDLLVEITPPQRPTGLQPDVLEERSTPDRPSEHVGRGHRKV